jgi:hypothetical protein
MALHRDIFWIGRQWAVTGFGMQAINQKHNGEFDIPIERLWDDDLSDTPATQKWFNPDDFNKGLAVARARYPQSLATPAPPKPVKVLPQQGAAIAPPAPIAPVVVAPVEALVIAPSERALDSKRVPSPEPVNPEKPAAPPTSFHMSLLGHPAKLLRVWRARRRR